MYVFSLFLSSHLTNYNYIKYQQEPTRAQSNQRHPPMASSFDCLTAGAIRPMARQQMPTRTTAAEGAAVGKGGFSTHLE